MTATRESYKPSHPGLFSIAFREGEYSSALIADKVSSNAPARTGRAKDFDLTLTAGFRRGPSVGAPRRSDERT